MEGVDQPIGRVAGDHIDLPARQSLVRQPEIHDTRRHREMHVVQFSQAGIAVLSFDEFVSKSGRPLFGIRRRIGNRFQFESLCVVSAHHNHKRIVEAQGFGPFDVELFAIVFPYEVVDLSGVCIDGLLQNCRQCRSGVLDVRIDLPCNQGLVANECSAQIQPALHGQRGIALDRLCE